MRARLPKFFGLFSVISLPNEEPKQTYQPTLNVFFHASHINYDSIYEKLEATRTTKKLENLIVLHKITHVTASFDGIDLHGLLDFLWWPDHIP
jgi:hypothetical protein